MGSIPGSGRYPGGGNGNPFQYSCLENPMNRGALQATVYGVTKSHTGEQELATSSGMIILKRQKRFKQQTTVLIYMRRLNNNLLYVLPYSIN